MQKKLTKFLKYGFPILIWALVIFTFSSFPTGKATEIHWQDFIIKKTAHIVEYAIFTALLYRGMIACGIDRKNAAMTAILIAIAYGASDEYHQSFTAGREPHLRDVGFDTIGSLLSIYGIWNIIPKMPVRLRELATKLELS